jgi:hypothetical protein
VSSAGPAGLFGIDRSNRDFTEPAAWGKNQFNSAFPIALTLFMESRGISPVELFVDYEVSASTVSKRYIEVEDLLMVPPGERYFQFEAPLDHYSELLVGPDISSDVLIRRGSATGNAVKALEVKLTVVPDNSTLSLPREDQASELVVRPPTIAQAALEVAQSFRGRREELSEIFLELREGLGDELASWSAQRTVERSLPLIASALEAVFSRIRDDQKPVLLQPIWRSDGASLHLDHHCFDVFVWNTHSLGRLYLDRLATEATTIRASRPARTVVWMVRLLYEFAFFGQMDPRRVFNAIVLGSRNDKAFSVVGRTTRPYLAGEELENPRVGASEADEIILGDGRSFLRPERRLDGALARD